MTSTQIFIATITAIIAIAVVYSHVGWRNIRYCYALWFDRKYWTSYNTVEALSWFTKALIIIPGLIFGVQIWQLFVVALITSLSLIWASNKKSLPTLVGFNTIWVWLSLMVLAQNLV